MLGNPKSYPTPSNSSCATRSDLNWGLRVGFLGKIEGILRLIQGCFEMVMQGVSLAIDASTCGLLD